MLGHGHHRQHGPAEQFPGAGRQREKGKFRPAFDVDDVQAERHQQHGEQHPAPMTDVAHQQHHHQREEDVVLLFYRQRPGMQQRLELRRRRKVAVFAHEQDVGNEQRLVTNRSPQFGKVLGRQQQPA
ncbi:hypothetical protein D3C81_1531450 [compost metagenome]